VGGILRGGSSSSLESSDISLSPPPISGIHFDCRCLSLSFFLRLSFCFLSRVIGMIRWELEGIAATLVLFR